MTPRQQYKKAYATLKDDWSTPYNERLYYTRDFATSSVIKAANGSVYESQQIFSGWVNKNRRNQWLYKHGEIPF